MNAITDDPSGSKLAGRFEFQYIPMSYFIEAGGKVIADSSPGPLTAELMRAKLDRLLQ